MDSAEERRERNREYMRRWRESNRERVREYNAAWKSAHPENVRRHQQTDRTRHHEDHKKKKNQRYADWRAANPLPAPSRPATGPHEKWCYKCEQVKLLGDFAIDRSRRDGLQPKCRSCMAAYQHRHRDGLRQYRADWYARNREDAKAKAKAWRDAHLEHAREVSRRYHTGHREKLRESGRLSVHRRRARKLAAGGSFTSVEWREVCEQAGYRCLACGASGKLTIDHVVPLSRGGTNDIGNIQPLCARCNKQKHTRIIDYRSPSGPSNQPRSTFP